MVYFSELVGKEIYDLKKNKVGCVKDFCFRDAPRYAKVNGIITKESPGKKISWGYVAGVGNYESDALPYVIYLNEKKEHLKFTKIKSSKVSDILDKQIIDVNGARVVRVNDALLGRVGKYLALIGVSIGTQGIFRRLGIPWLANRSKEHIILWKDVSSLSTNIEKLQVKQQAEKINQLHSSEIADLIRDLNLEEKLMLFNNLSREKAAKTLLKAQPEERENVFRTLSLKKIAGMLEVMQTHDAASILSMMRANSVKVLRLMKPGIADKIKKLMKYKKSTAGALMSTRFISVTEDFNVGNVAVVLKKKNPEVRHVLYIYVTDDDGRLKGVLSLKQLIFNEKKTPVSKLMKTDVITISPKTYVDDIINIMSKYELSTLPVVDRENKMLGVIRVHDMFEVLVPKRIKKERIVKAKVLGKKDGN